MNASTDRKLFTTGKLGKSTRLQGSQPFDGLSSRFFAHRAVQMFCRNGCYFRSAGRVG